MTRFVAEADYVLFLRDILLVAGANRVLDIGEIGIKRFHGISSVLLGPNGAGKTSIVNSLTGYVQSVSGSATLVTDRSYSLLRMRAYRIVKAGLVRTFQVPPTYPSIKVRDILMLACSQGRPILGRSWSQSKSVGVVLSVSKQLEIDRVLDLRCDALDLSTAKRVELARCLLCRPRCILLDEPTAGLSSRERWWWFQTLTESLADLAFSACGQGSLEDSVITIGMITHDVELLGRLAGLPHEPDGFFVEDGKVSTAGPLSAVLEAKHVASAYLT